LLNLYFGFLGQKKQKQKQKQNTGKIPSKDNGFQEPDACINLLIGS
jgi:hypothetical protein